MLKRYGSRNLLFASILFLGLVFIFSSSCRRNKDCDLVVTIVDISGAPITGTVHVFTSIGNNPDMDQTSVTDAQGMATFTFKLPAILDCEVTPDPVWGLGTTKTPVKLEEGKSVSKKITCQ